MKYKGFTIEPVRDTIFIDETKIIEIDNPWFGKQKKKIKTNNYIRKEGAISHYNVLDPLDDECFCFACNTIEECKDEIIKLLVIMNIKDNTPKSWNKIGGYPSKERMDYLLNKAKNKVGLIE